MICLYGKLEKPFILESWKPWFIDLKSVEVEFLGYRPEHFYSFLKCIFAALRRRGAKKKVAPLFLRQGSGFGGALIRLMYSCCRCQKCS